jgi:hypothetical protein
MDNLQNIQFSKSDLKSPLEGLFNIFLNYENDIIYKKIKTPVNKNNIGEYKDVMMNLKSMNIINKYIYHPEEIVIEDDGSYYSKYISNNITFYEIFTGKNIDSVPIEHLYDIVSNFKTLLEDLKKVSVDGIVCGDWAVHNIVYDKITKGLYNVDLEGFYTSMHRDWDVKEIKSIEQWYMLLIKQLKDIGNNYSVSKVINTIKYVKSSGKDYSANHIDIGYHSIELNGKYYRGQRDCMMRLEFIEKEIDLSNKNILDIGCCIGGMLFPLDSKIKSGVGIDFNYKNVNAGNKIANYKKSKNIVFYQFDLDKESLYYLSNFTHETVDVTFLFSVCMWIKKWRQLIDYIRERNSVLFIETNGSQVQQLEQLQYCQSKYTNVKILYDRSDDDPGQKKRKLYMCTI